MVRLARQRPRRLFLPGEVSGRHVRSSRPRLVTRGRTSSRAEDRDTQKHAWMLPRSSPSNAALRNYALESGLSTPALAVDTSSLHRVRSRSALLYATDLPMARIPARSCVVKRQCMRCQTCWDPRGTSLSTRTFGGSGSKFALGSLTRREILERRMAFRCVGLQGCLEERVCAARKSRASASRGEFGCRPYSDSRLTAARCNRRTACAIPSGGFRPTPAPGSGCRCCRTKAAPGPPAGERRRAARTCRCGSAAPWPDTR